jgi:hypothetical protein
VNVKLTDLSHKLAHIVAMSRQVVGIKAIRQTGLKLVFDAGELNSCIHSWNNNNKEEEKSFHSRRICHVGRVQTCPEDDALKKGSSSPVRVRILQEGSLLGGK